MRFQVEFDIDQSKKDMSRVHICFDEEHPVKFVNRVADAH
jgi:hypothetical protein